MINAERVTGADIHRIIAEGELSSIRERSGNLSTITDIRRVILVGSTCVGKSTLEQAVRTASLEDPLLRGKISVPLRVATRLPRLDDGDGIYLCSLGKFGEMVTTNQLGLYGIKIMEGGRQESYGYLQPAEGTLPVFFANNQTLRNRISIRPEEVLQGALIIAIYAPDRIREERLRVRSPQLFEERPQEVAFRLSEEERAIGLAPDVHLILKNYGRFANRSAQDITRLIKGIINLGCTVCTGNELNYE